MAKKVLVARACSLEHEIDLCLIELKQTPGSNGMALVARDGS